MFDYLDTGAPGRIDHFERSRQTAFVIDADLRHHERWVCGTDLPTGDQDFWSWHEKKRSIRS